MRVIFAVFIAIVFGTPVPVFASTAQPTQWVPTLASLLERLYPEAIITQEGDSVVMTLWSATTSGSKVDSTTQTIEVSVTEEIGANAFAIAGDKKENRPGQIRLTRPLMSLLQSESELAFVLAHEVAHIRHDHFSVRFPLSMLTPTQLDRITKTHQRWELDADREAITVSRRAGYDGLSAIQVLERLQAANPDRKTTCVHNHPLIHERLESIKDGMLTDLVQAVSRDDRNEKF